MDGAKIKYYNKKEMSHENKFDQKVGSLKSSAIKEVVRNIYMTHTIINSYDNDTMFMFSVNDNVRIDCGRIASELNGITKSLKSDLMLHRVVNNLFFFGSSLEIIAANFNVRFDYGLELMIILNYYADIFDFDLCFHHRYCFVLKKTPPKSQLGFMITNAEGDRTIFQCMFTNSLGEISAFMQNLNNVEGARGAFVCVDRIMPFIDPVLSVYDELFYKITAALPLPESMARHLYVTEGEKYDYYSERIMTFLKYLDECLNLPNVDKKPFYIYGQAFNFPLNMNDASLYPCSFLGCFECEVKTCKLFCFHAVLILWLDCLRKMFVRYTGYVNRNSPHSQMVNSAFDAAYMNLDIACNQLCVYEKTKFENILNIRHVLEDIDLL